jgi:hypothetical protein
MVGKLSRIGFVSFIGFMLIFNVIAVSSSEISYIMTLESPEPNTSGEFGFYAIDINENYILIGENRGRHDGLSQAGNAYLFDLEGNHILSLQAPEPQLRSRFGSAVGLKNDKIYVGEYKDQVDDHNDAGKVHIFELDGTHIETIVSPEPGDYNVFGRNLYFVKDKLLVSEIKADIESIVDAGKTHVFDLDGNYLSSIQSPQPSHEGYIGGAIATNDDIIIVGEETADVEDLVRAGKVHLFDVDGVYLSSILSPEPQIDGWFGASVGIGGDILLINEEDYSDEMEGELQVHVFDLDGNHLKTIKSPKPEAGGAFGELIISLGEIIIISEVGADGGSKDEGKIHLYNKEGTYLETLQAPEPAPDAGYGNYLYTNGEWVAVYESGSEVGKFGAGKVHLYRLGEHVESQEPVEETTPETEESESETEPRGGIPGYPFWSIGLAIVLYSLLVYKRSTSIKIE